MFKQGVVSVLLGIVSFLFSLVDRFLLPVLEKIQDEIEDGQGAEHQDQGEGGSMNLKQLLIDVDAAVCLFTRAISITAWSGRDRNRYDSRLVKQAHETVTTIQEIIPRLKLLSLHSDIQQCEWVIMAGLEEEARCSSMAQAVARLTTMIRDRLKDKQEAS